MKSVVLHIGLHKTGTTYLQKTLGLNYDALQRRGILYYVDGEYRDQWWAHCTVALSVRSEPHPAIDFAEERDAVWARFLRKVEESPSDVALVSAEVFLEGVDVAYVKSRLEEMNTHVVAYLRDEVELFRAIYYQQVQGGLDLSMEDFYQLSSERVVNFEDRLSGWQATFGDRLHLRDYGKAKSREGGLFQDFVDSFGIASSKWDLPSGRPNHTWSDDMVELLRRVNALPISSEERKNLRAALSGIERQNASVRALPALHVPERLAELIVSENRGRNQVFWDRCRSGSILA